MVKNRNEDEYQDYFIASRMNTTDFWDASVVVPTGKTFTNKDGISADQITSGTLDPDRMPFTPTGISKASDMNNSSFWDANVVVPTGKTFTNKDGINADQITSGTLDPKRLPSVASGITKASDMVEEFWDVDTFEIPTAATIKGKLTMTEGKKLLTVENDSDDTKITLNDGDTGNKTTLDFNGVNTND